MSEADGNDELESRVRGLERYTRARHQEAPSGFAYRGLEIVGLSPAIHEKMAEYADRYLAKGSTILDLGCGSGALCARMADHGFRPSGCDALRDSFKLHGEVPFHAADLNSDFADAIGGPFDAISATEIIEHLENPRHFLRQCRRLLRPGGRIFMTTPNIDSPMAKAIYVRTGTFLMFADSDYDSWGHIMPMSRWVLTKALQEAGFRILDVSSVGEWGRFLNWWKMRSIGWILDKLGGQREEPGQILTLAAELPG